LDDSSDFECFRKWTTAGTSNDTHFWAQLNHPGKQTPKFLNEEPVAPSAIPLKKEMEKGFNTPRALTEPEIETLISVFANSARLAKKVGFTGVQIHGAHGYLVSQFLSSRHNQRSDRWGGSLVNRMRFMLEIYRAIREVVGEDYPVGIKLNSADFMEGGFTEAESMEVIKALSEAGIDMIEISGGTYESPAMMGVDLIDSTLRREAYFLDYTEQVRKQTSTPLMVTGGFRSSTGMRLALQSRATDFIGLARILAIDPQAPNKAIANKNFGVEIRPLTTGIELLDKISMLNITWYEHQLERMGNNKIPKPNQSTWVSFFKTLSGVRSYSRHKRRA